MKIFIEKRYIIFPVNVLTEKKKVSFSKDGKSLYTLSVNLDNIEPNFSAYVDVSRFIGEELELTVTPEMPLKFELSDEMRIEDLYHERLRPTVHFTTKNGWINDPNGLIYLNGVYHMFYQHNPCSSEWENMHWGHATSPDLIHWTEQPIALYPDDSGMMFSGSAILDKENITGLGSKENPPALLYYTATNPFSQHLAYSTDGFKTVTKYENNPIIERIVGSNRDPKVVFCDEIGAYIMALYFEKDVYGILKSNDLISWELIQKLSIEGDNECPDIFPITSTDGKRKWILMGAHNRYSVGNMNKNGFTPEQETLSLYYGRSAYAGQTFSGIPDERVVRVDWDRWQTKTETFSGQMSIPLELSLEKIADTYYLAATPVRELECIYGEIEKQSALKINAGESICYKLSESAYRIDLKINDYSSVPDFTITIFGREFICKASENKVLFGKESFPLSISKKGVDISFIIDKCSIEIFLDGGKIYASVLNNLSVADYNLPFVSLSSKCNAIIDTLDIIPLKSIWE